MAAVVVGAFLPPGWPDGVVWLLRIAGAALAILGGVLAVTAGRALGRSLTPFPRPATGGALVEDGPFRLVRHPIYGGGILFFVGIGLATSVSALVAALVLGVWWELKSLVEERLLAERYPEYPEYARRVPRRVLPWLW